MSDESKKSVAREFLEAVAQEKIAGDTRLVVELAGDISNSRINKFELLSSGQVKFFDSSIAPGEDGEDVVVGLPPPEGMKLFQLFSRGLDSLRLRSEAGFLPDSEVGSVRILMGGREETRYFLVNPIDRAIQRRPIAAEIEEALELLRSVPERFKQDGPSYEKRY